MAVFTLQSYSDVGKGSRTFEPITGDTVDLGDLSTTRHGEWTKAGGYIQRTIYIYNTGGTNDMKVMITLIPSSDDGTEIVYISPDGTKTFDGDSETCVVEKGDCARVNIEDVCDQINISCVSATTGQQTTFKILPKAYQT